jgi:DNA primase
MRMKSYKKYKKLTTIEAIHLVKNSIDIEAVLDYYAGISLENVKGRKTKLISCIFHQERTPSLAITPLMNVFHCFGCQAKGDVITLVSLLKKVSQGRAAFIIAEDFGLLNKVKPQLKLSIKERAIEKELERNFQQKEKELFDFLLQVKQHFKAITKSIKNERDLQRKGGLYHIIAKIEYYLDLLFNYEGFSPEERIDNYILIQRFIEKEIYPIYKAVQEKAIEEVSISE